MAHGGDGVARKPAVGSSEGKPYVAAQKRGDHGRVVLRPAKEGSVTHATVRNAVETVVSKRSSGKAAH